MFNRLTNNFSNLLPELTPLGWEGFASVHPEQTELFGRSQLCWILENKAFSTGSPTTMQAAPYLQLAEMANDASLPIAIPVLGPTDNYQAGPTTVQPMDWRFLHNGLTAWWSSAQRDLFRLLPQTQDIARPQQSIISHPIGVQSQGTDLDRTAFEYPTGLNFDSSLAQRPTVPLSSTVNPVTWPQITPSNTANLPIEIPPAPSMLPSTSILSADDQPLVRGLGLTPNSGNDQAEPPTPFDLPSSAAPVLAHPANQQQQPAFSSSPRPETQTPAIHSPPIVEPSPSTTMNFQGGIHVQITAQKIDRDHAQETARVIAGHVLKEINRITDRERFRRGLPPTR